MTDFNFGDLRRTTPISREFGYDRGVPVDRYFMEQFLAEHASDIKGRVLEIGDDSYSRQFGGERVTQQDILHVHAGNPIATFVGDLTSADHIPSNAFDCFICTQTLHLIFNYRAAMATIHRILKLGGVLLMTFPGISQRSNDNDEWSAGWHWSFTSKLAYRLFGEFYPVENFEILY